MERDGDVISYTEQEIREEIGRLAHKAGVTSAEALDFAFHHDIDDLPDEHRRNWVTWHNICSFAFLLPDNPLRNKMLERKR